MSTEQEVHQDTQIDLSIGSLAEVEGSQTPSKTNASAADEISSSQAQTVETVVSSEHVESTSVEPMDGISAISPSHTGPIPPSARTVIAATTATTTTTTAVPPPPSVFKLPTLPSKQGSTSSATDVPLDLKLIHEMVGVDEGAVEQALAGAVNGPDSDIESSPSSSSSGDEDSASSSSSSSSSDSDSDSSSSSATKPFSPRSVHKKHLRELKSLIRSPSPASADPILDSDEDEGLDTTRFASANELPPPVEAPPLPMERVDPESTLRELGRIKSAVGKMVVVECVDKKGEDVLGENTIVCWEDGRVLGLVQDTFGPTASPLYTMLLPTPFTLPPSLLASVPSTLPEISVSSELAEVSSFISDKPDSPSSAETEVEALVTADLAPSSPPANSTPHSIPSPKTSDDDLSAEISEPIVESTSVPQEISVPQEAQPPVPLSALVGMLVYYPVDMGRFVPTARLRLEKWTDASNKFDEEVGADEMEWSDDELEAEAKKRRKLSRNSRAPSNRGSPTPSLSSTFPPVAYSAAGSTYAESAYSGRSDDDDASTVLDYDSDESTGPALPGRALPAPYDDLDLGAGLSAGADGAGGGKKKRARERKKKGPKQDEDDRRGEMSTRGGRGRERGNMQGVGRGGPNRGRGRGGLVGAQSGSRGSFSNPGFPSPAFGGQAMNHPGGGLQQPTHGLPQRPQSPPSQQPSGQPMSPTSLAIARATGQFNSTSTSAPPSLPTTLPTSSSHPSYSSGQPPFNPGQPVYRPQSFQPGMPMYPSHPGAKGGFRPSYQAAYQAAYNMSPSGQPQLPYGGSSYPMYNMYGTSPAGYAPQSNLPTGGVSTGPLPAHNDPTVQAALQAQQAAHNKQILDMQRQIALLSRKPKSGQDDGSGGASGAGDI
ncbi:Uncharacterized conserved protein [Phaffia rhodozyma]|uniref:H/ACA ribonucleoprotein complex non-core subunit NAF1 n=1 Tax=Phaffia rhodozyma TaxID=264483 RepID=A0A0F7SVA3_PHARH|nr:Uncharacterized conserved protein [Phaffia rhodozyma]